MGLATTMTPTTKNPTVEAAKVKGYVKIAKAAKMLGVSPRTVTRWIHDNYFPGTIKSNPKAKTGSPYLIPEEAIDKFQEERKISPDSPNAENEKE